MRTRTMFAGFARLGSYPTPAPGIAHTQVLSGNRWIDRRTMFDSDKRSATMTLVAIDHNAGVLSLCRVRLSESGLWVEGRARAWIPRQVRAGDNLWDGYSWVGPKWASVALDVRDMGWSDKVQLLEAMHKADMDKAFQIVEKGL